MYNCGYGGGDGGGNEEQLHHQHDALHQSVLRGMGPAAHDDDADPMDAALSEQLRRSRDFTAEEAASAAAAAATTTTTLGDLPPEIVAYVLKMAAPAVPIYAPIEQPRALEVQVASAQAGRGGPAPQAAAAEDGASTPRRRLREAKAQDASLWGT